MKIDTFIGKYEFLSNYFERPMKYKDFKCTSSESAYQAMKTKNTNIQKLICELEPDKAKKLAHKLTKESPEFLRKDWEHIKYSIMLDIVREKFTQHKDLAHKLIETRNAYLEEGNTWNDTYYGVCNGVGKNNLGKILMQVRKELKEMNKDVKRGYETVKLPCNVPGIGYTVKHRRVVNLLINKYAKQLLKSGTINKEDYQILVNRGKCHDMDKILTSLSYPQMTADYFHRLFNGHHLECLVGEYSKYDYIEMIMDMESAHYTKPDKPGNAYIFCSTFRPWVMPHLKPYFDILGLNDIVYTDEKILKLAKQPVYENELIENIIDYIHLTGIHMMDYMSRVDDSGAKSLGITPLLRHPVTHKTNSFTRPNAVVKQSKSMENLEFINGTIWAQVFDMDKICVLSVSEREKVNELSKLVEDKLLQNKAQR